MTADNGATPDVPYEQTTAFVWTKDVYSLLENGDMSVDIHTSSGVTSTRVSGPCPRCGHRLDDNQVGTAIADLITRSGSSVPMAPMDTEVILQIDITCGCGLAHAGAPPKVTGCGVSFRVEVEPDTGGNATGAP